MKHTARELYMASLDANTELNARRLAERSGIPDNDPMWLLLHEMQRSMREVTTGANNAIANEPFADRISRAVASAIVRDERVIATLTKAINQTNDAATRAIRSLETSLREATRKQAAAPIASLAFAFALGLTACVASIWSAYHAGSINGYDSGYRSGYHDRGVAERGHK